jgi:hypothetical protein
MTSFSKIDSAGSEPPVTSISFHNGMILTRMEGVTKFQISLILRWLVGVTRILFDTIARIRQTVSCEFAVREYARTSQRFQ